MLWHIVRRVRYARGLGEVVVATSERPEDRAIRSFCRGEGISVFSGSESDVLDRFYRAAAAYRGDPLVRVTGDCPLVDPDLIERLLKIYATGSYDHVSVAAGAGALFLDGDRFPDGLDAECFSFAALEKAWRHAEAPSDREHVTPYIWRVPGRFRLHLLKSEVDYSSLRWSVDHAEDFRMVTRIYEALYRDDRAFGFGEVIDYLGSHPDLARLNRAWVGREGYERVWHPEGPNRSEP
jgi:spore coat polysaccharide biosynthesis protein SpsF